MTSASRSCTAAGGVLAAQRMSLRAVRVAAAGHGRLEGVYILAIGDLDDATIESAGAPVAREHAAARQIWPELPAGFDSADICAAALQRLRDSGHRGLVVTGAGHVVAVRVAGAQDLDTVSHWSRCSTAPRHRMFAPPQDPPLAAVAAEHQGPGHH